ncbi:MAG: diguanylate cyclase [Betaproteobacteria bacterium]
MKQIAQWLFENLGDANLIARVGADQFAIVLPDIKAEEDVARVLEAATVAERV